MNPDQEIESLENEAEESETDDSMSVDDFIRELEAKEKDLHITAETTVIELAAGFDDGELPEFMKDEFPEKPVKTVKPATQAKEKAAQNKLEAENKQLKEKLAKFEDERAEMIKDSQRRSRDFENFKSRTERERRESFQNQVGNLAVQMLPVLDNLDRAVDFALEHEHTRNDEFLPFFDGVVLVNQQVNDVLAGMGIVPITTIGEEFDPHFHEAAATEETDEFLPNTICGEMLKGYRIGERVIRHSVVRVAKPRSDTNDRSVLEKMFKHESDEMEQETEVPESSEENVEVEPAE